MLRSSQGQISSVTIQRYYKITDYIPYTMPFIPGTYSFPNLKPASIENFFFLLPFLDHPSHAPSSFTTFEGLVKRIQRMAEMKSHRHFYKAGKKGQAQSCGRLSSLKNPQHSCLLKNSWTQQEEKLDIAMCG